MVDSAVTSSTYIVQINVNATKVVQHKVSNCIGALDGIRVAIKRVEEPRILVGDEFAGLLVGPELVLSAPFTIYWFVVVLPYTHSRGAGQCSSAGAPSNVLECSR